MPVTHRSLARPRRFIAATKEAEGLPNGADASISVVSLGSCAL